MALTKTYLFFEDLASLPVSYSRIRRHWCLSTSDIRKTATLVNTDSKDLDIM